MTAQQLRKSILQMAVQGKLVPQDPSDEPAHILLERIRAEKERLIKEKKIKKEKNPSVIYRGTDNLHYEKFPDGTIKCIEEEIPFDIPESWAWVRLGTISTYAETKRKINIQEAPSDVWSLDLEDIEKGGRLLEYKTAKDRKTVGDRNIFKAGNILYSKLRPYLLKILIAQKDGICSSEIVPFSLYGGIISEYVITVLKCPYIDNLINSATYGVKMPRVSTETMSSLFIPIPSIKEQQRIVRKLNEVTPIISEYDSAYSRVKELDIKFPQQLKRSVLQYAVQGKLVQQDESDEPASVLLDRIRAEKEELIKQGKIKRDKRESVIYQGADNSYYERFADGSENCIDEEIPFEIPKGWAWTHLSDITQILNGDRGQNYPAKNKLITKGVPFVSASNIESGVVSSNNLLCMTEEQYDALRAGKLIDNDIVYCIRGSLGKCGVFTMSKGAIASSLAIIRPFHTLYILREYLFLYLNSPLARSEIQKYDNGSAQPNLAAKDLMNFLVPLPPPMEAKMIVQKVKNIFTRVEEINAASM